LREWRRAVEVRDAAPGELARGRILLTHARSVVARPAQTTRAIRLHLLAMTAQHILNPSVLWRVVMGSTSGQLSQSWICSRLFPSPVVVTRSLPPGTDTSRPSAGSAPFRSSSPAWSPRAG